MNRAIVFVVLTVFFVAPLGFADEPTIHVTGGQISGAIVNNVQVYKGIPYAAPPKGELRWRAPQPVVPWDGIRDCTEFGPQCPQAPYPEGSFYAREPREQDEDCLYLNVWSTANPGDSEAVMVWIHGGALTRGSGDIPYYDGEVLARKGVVVVTINYRLNVFGFLAHGELSRESMHGSSGNFGIMDQIAALQWVRNNIHAFGGDPNRVLIFGESAGSWSVNLLQASPLAKGLFQRAIGESGGQFGTMPRLAYGWGSAPSAESQGARFLEALGVSTIAEARAKSTAEVLDAYGSFRGSLPPNVDGWVLPEDVYTIFANGWQSDVPVIVGFNKDEGTSLSGNRYPTSVEAYESSVRDRYGDLADEILRVYPAKSKDDVRDAYFALYRDRAFGWQMRTWARMMDSVDSNAYLYFFSHAPSRPDKDIWGAYHAAEIVYAFDNLSKTPYPNLQEDFRVANRMSQYWVNFANTGNPNGEGLPEWPAYDRESEPYMEFADDAGAGDHLLQEQIDVLEKVFAAQREGR